MARPIAGMTTNGAFLLQTETVDGLDEDGSALDGDLDLAAVHETYLGTHAARDDESAGPVDGRLHTMMLPR